MSLIVKICHWLYKIVAFFQNTYYYLPVENFNILEGAERPEAPQV
jgi:hypothetical protein